MPSPLGHALAGLTVHVLMAARDTARRTATGCERSRIHFGGASGGSRGGGAAPPCSTDELQLWQGARVAVALGAAVAPDLDLLLRFVDGRNHHHGLSHSVGAAVAATVATMLVSRLASRP